MKDIEGYFSKNRPARVQNNRTVLVLLRYVSYDFSAPTPREGNSLNVRVRHDYA